MDLGLVYDITVDGRDIIVDMSLTSPGCPAGPQIMGDAFMSGELPMNDVLVPGPIVILEEASDLITR